MSYLVKASIHFNSFPIELFIFSSLRVIVPILAGDGTYGSREISPGHVLSVAFTLFSALTGESRRHPEASITISPVFICTGGPMENKISGSLHG